MSLFSAGYTLAPEGGVFSQSFLPGAGPLLSGSGPCTKQKAGTPLLSLMLCLLIGCGSVQGMAD